MMRVIIIITLSSISYITYGQGGFVKFLDSGPLARNEIFDIYYDEEVNQLFVLGNDIDTFFISLKISSLDTLGNLMDTVLFKGNNDYSYSLGQWNEIQKIDLNRYAVYSDLLFSDHRQFVYEFDKHFDSLNYKVLEEQNGIKANSAAGFIGDLSEIRMVGRKQQSSFERDFYFQILNENRELEKEVFFGYQNGLNENPTSITSVGDEYFISGSSSTETPTMLSDPWDSDYYIVHIDKDGNLLNEIHSQTDTKDGIVSELVYFETEQGEGRLAFGSTLLGVDALANSFTSKIRYLIIDMEGNIQNSISIGNDITFFNYLSYNKRVEDGFIVAGQIAVPESNRLSPFICKINENADTLWCTTPLVDIEAPTLGQSFITGMQILPSGSILLCGNYKNFGGNPNIARPFIMKLDKDGCLEPGCRTVTSTAEVEVDERYSISPNPTSGLIQLTTDRAGVLTLYGVTGIKLKSIIISKGMNNIDISDLESGIIIYHLTVGIEVQTGKLIKL